MADNWDVGRQPGDDPERVIRAAPIVASVAALPPGESRDLAIVGTPDGQAYMYDADGWRPAYWAFGKNWGAFFGHLPATGSIPYRRRGNFFVLDLPTETTGWLRPM